MNKRPGQNLTLVGAIVAFLYSVADRALPIELPEVVGYISYYLLIVCSVAYLSLRYGRYIEGKLRVKEKLPSETLMVLSSIIIFCGALMLLFGFLIFPTQDRPSLVVNLQQGMYLEPNISTRREIVTDIPLAILIIPALIKNQSSESVTFEGLLEVAKTGTQSASSKFNLLNSDSGVADFLISTLPKIYPTGPGVGVTHVVAPHTIGAGDTLNARLIFILGFEQDARSIFPAGVSDLPPAFFTLQDAFSGEVLTEEVFVSGH